MSNMKKDIIEAIFNKIPYQISNGKIPTDEEALDLANEIYQQLVEKLAEQAYKIWLGDE